MRGGGASGEGREGRGAPARLVRAALRGPPASARSRALAPREAATRAPFEASAPPSRRWEGP